MDFYKNIDDYDRSQSWSEEDEGEGEPNVNFDYTSTIEGILQKALEKILDEGPENVIRDILSKKNENILDLETRINNLTMQISMLEARVQYLESLLLGRNFDPTWDSPYGGGISTTGTSTTSPF